MKKREVAIEAINCWDDDSMSVLYDEYYAALVSYGLQILHLKEEAEDVVQSVYAKLWESQPSFESTGELRSYGPRGIVRGGRMPLPNQRT